MKRLIYILLIAVTLGNISCNDTAVEAGFKDALQYSIYSYLMANKEEYSSFISILEVGGIDKTLSAYNPYGPNYTLFLPDNKAIDKFIETTEEFSSLDEILANKKYCEIFSRYHVLNMAVHTQDFPFGAFPETTLSDDYLTVSFIIEPDTSYYKINNQAAVIVPNIHVSNGYIHQIDIALKPITYTSYEWLGKKSGYSIFKNAVDITGLQELIDFNIKEDEERQPVTLLIEPDRIYQKYGVNSVSDLANMVSPDDNDYTNLTNPFNNFVRYHILTGSMFLNDFEDANTNYTTLSEIPLNIDGTGMDIVINKGKEVFDTIVTEGDTTLIDYITFLYDESNVLTQSGAIHFIDHIMTQQPPSRANKYYAFWEETLLNKYRKKPGTYLIEDHDALHYIEWSGADLFFVKLGDLHSSAWGNDYLEIDGDFMLSYNVPKIIQGKYDVFIAANAFNVKNAVIEVYIDGKKVSGLIDLSKGGTTSSPFKKIKVGTVDFIKYSSHLVEIRPLIPGRFQWDYVSFEIPKKQ
jgi:uncharacterized surface protein with fasciclin (FAS1) repeats